MGRRCNRFVANKYKKICNIDRHAPSEDPSRDKEMASLTRMLSKLTVQPTKTNVDLQVTPDKPAVVVDSFKTLGIRTPGFPEDMGPLAQFMTGVGARGWKGTTGPVGTVVEEGAPTSTIEVVTVPDPVRPDKLELSFPVPDIPRKSSVTPSEKAVTVPDPAHPDKIEVSSPGLTKKPPLNSNEKPKEKSPDVKKEEVAAARSSRAATPNEMSPKTSTPASTKVVTVPNVTKSKPKQDLIPSPVSRADVEPKSAVQVKNHSTPSSSPDATTVTASVVSPDESSDWSEVPFRLSPKRPRLLNTEADYATGDYVGKHDMRKSNVSPLLEEEVDLRETLPRHPMVAPHFEPRPLDKLTSPNQEGVFKRLRECNGGRMMGGLVDLSILCRVVGYRKRDKVYVETVGSVGIFEEEGRFLVLDSTSTNRGFIQTPFLDLPATYTIRVYSIQRRYGANKTSVMSLLRIPIWTVKSFTIVEKPQVRRGIVAVVESHPHEFAVDVVGTHHPRPHRVHVAKGAVPGPEGLLIGDIYHLKYPAKAFLMHGVLMFVQAGAVGDKFHMSVARRLTDYEFQMIDTMCRKEETLSREQAELFIRDPLVAISRLRHHISGKSVKDTAVTVLVPNDYETGQMRISLTREEARRCIGAKSMRSWKVGTELVVEDPSYCEIDHHRKSERFATSGSHSIFAVMKRMIVHIVEITEHGLCTKVTLAMSQEASSRLAILERAGTRLAGHICVGHRHDPDDARSAMLVQRFPALFGGDSERFRQLTGRAGRPSFAVDHRGNVGVAGHQLDRSQLVGVWTSLANPGITTISAPAGSGKTLMLEGIILKSVTPDPKQGDCEAGHRLLVAATTNPAATNIILTMRNDLVAGSSLRLCRNFGASAEAELGTNRPLNSEISLRRMAENARAFLPNLDSHPALLQAMEAIERCREDLKETTTVGDGVVVMNQLKVLQKKMMGHFCSAYHPHVFGSTVDMISHTPELCRGYDHLILDEAAQMDTISAFTLYGTYPKIERITLVGDSRQLRPFSELSPTSDAGKLFSIGELTRLEKCQNVAHVQLNTIYRCNPLLTAMLWKPIYGNGILAHDDRFGKRKDLARRKNLTVAKDGSPCLFVQVDGQNDSEGVNVAEMNACITLLNNLKVVHDVDLSDVAIICNHRAQKAEIIKYLQNMGEIGHLRLPCIVSTVDSFQGKESKIMIVLTTKTTDLRDSQSIDRHFRFVGDPHRGTVAVTRATDIMYVFGDWSKLARTFFWSRFVPNIIGSGALVSMVNGHFERIEAKKFFTPDSRRPGSL